MLRTCYVECTYHPGVVVLFIVWVAKWEFIILIHVLLSGVVIWAFHIASIEDMVQTSHTLSSSDSRSSFLKVLVGSTAVCSGWSTLALNIADLSRFSKSPRDLVVGQVAAFPILNIMTPIFGIAIFCAAKKAYPQNISKDSWNLTELFAVWPTGWGFVGTMIYTIATLSTNCTANLLSAANDSAYDVLNVEPIDHPTILKRMPITQTRRYARMHARTHNTFPKYVLVKNTLKQCTVLNLLLLYICRSIESRATINF